MNISFYDLLFLFLLTIFSFSILAFGATLSKDEVEALKDIANTLGKKDWDFSVDPCSGEQNWTSSVQVKGSENAVTCNCSFVNNTICHVTNILLKQQNLPGTLPPELIRLPHLQEIDFTRNYLNGTIPKEWGSMNLVNISLLGNRLTGSIPIEITNISTLQSLVLEANQLSGNLPLELGNLTQIQRLLLSSNNFTGQLPATMAKLTTLQDIRISDNQFTGKIPDFIQSWTSLQKLVIEGSGLSGPIPSGISNLKNLTDLRISDLNGSEHSPFPQLNDMNLKYLILRSCNINGTLPSFLRTLTSLKNLDLSFNKLSGPIPSNYDALRKVDFIYFTGNRLTGPVPSWSEKADNLDLSYNNFSISQGSPTCQDRKVNLFSSSSSRNNSGIVPCSTAFMTCPKTSYGLHINCGGNSVQVNGTTYDEDLDPAGAARFYQSGNNWAFSTTGNFMDNDVGDYNIWSSKSSLSLTNAELFTKARVSPTSLTYYGFWWKEKSKKLL